MHALTDNTTNASSNAGVSRQKRTPHNTTKANPAQHGKSEPRCAHRGAHAGSSGRSSSDSSASAAAASDARGAGRAPAAAATARPPRAPTCTAAAARHVHTAAQRPLPDTCTRQHSGCCSTHAHGSTAAAARHMHTAAQRPLLDTCTRQRSRTHVAKRTPTPDRHRRCAQSIAASERDTLPCGGGGTAVHTTIHVTYVRYVSHTCTSARPRVNLMSSPNNMK